MDWGRIHLGYELPTTSYNLAFNISLLFSLIISYVIFAKKKEPVLELSLFKDSPSSVDISRHLRSVALCSPLEPFKLLHFLLTFHLHSDDHVV